MYRLSLTTKVILLIQKHELMDGEDQTGTTAAGGGVQLSAGTAKDARERRRKMKVMVAIDESDGSFYALKWALHILFTTMPTVVFLVHVQPKFHHYMYPVGPGLADPLVPSTAFYATSAVVDSVKKAQEERSAAILSRALQMCKEKLVKAESMILNGDPREMICQAAEQMQVDLLVMGSRGLGKLKRAFIGSVSDYCAHHAKTPILIVKPPMEHTDKKH